MDTVVGATKVGSMPFVILSRSPGVTCVCVSQCSYTCILSPPVGQLFFQQSSLPMMGLLSLMLLLLHLLQAHVGLL